MNETKINCKNLLFNLTTVPLLQPMLWNHFSLGVHQAGREHSAHINLRDSDTELCQATRWLEQVLPIEWDFSPFPELFRVYIPKLILYVREKTLQPQQLPDPGMLQPASLFGLVSRRNAASCVCRWHLSSVGTPGKNKNESSRVIYSSKEKGQFLVYKFTNAAIKEKHLKEYRGGNPGAELSLFCSFFTLSLSAKTTKPLQQITACKTLPTGRVALWF